MNSEHFEVVVVGAGLSGIITAQRYLNLNPSAQIVILERDENIGGVWSRRRNHDNFWTQWTHGLSEFSDMPMPRPPEEDCRDDFYPAKYTTEYLENYVLRKDRNGRSLRDRIVFNISVQTIMRANDEKTWKITCSRPSEPNTIITSDKLLIASGLTSTPSMPTFADQDTFKGPIIHSIDFGSRVAELIASKNIQHITVLGAGKSSADMIYLLAKAGKTVTWVLRRPGFFAPGGGQGGYKNAIEASSARIAGVLNPNLFETSGWLVGFFHRSRIGRALLTKVFDSLDVEIKGLADYKRRKSAKGFEKLEYETPFFWASTPSGLLHHPDFWDIIATSVSAHRANIDSLSSKCIHLSTGEDIKSDALLCGTGYIHSHSFFSPELSASLGLPHPPSLDAAYETEKWHGLEDAADKEILARYPVLANPPKDIKRDTIKSTPYRLYNGMLPLPSSTNHLPPILFLSHIETTNMLFTAEVQAMWAAAYLSFPSCISLPPVEDMEKAVALVVQFSRRRYLGYGSLGNNITFECISYADKLLEDMGLTLKGKGWWTDLVGVVKPADLKVVWEEFSKRVIKEDGVRIVN